MSPCQTRRHASKCRCSLFSHPVPVFLFTIIFVRLWALGGIAVPPRTPFFPRGLASCSPSSLGSLGWRWTQAEAETGWEVVDAPRGGGGLVTSCPPIAPLNRRDRRACLQDIAAVYRPHVLWACGHQAVKRAIPSSLEDKGRRSHPCNEHAGVDLGYIVHFTSDSNVKQAIQYTFYNWAYL